MTTQMPLSRPTFRMRSEFSLWTSNRSSFRSTKRACKRSSTSTNTSSNKSKKPCGWGTPSSKPSTFQRMSKWPLEVFDYFGWVHAYSPPVKMIVFCSSDLHTKGWRSTRFTGAVELSFATFLTLYVPRRNSTALHLCERLQEDSCTDLSIAYHVWVRSQRIASALRVKDVAQQKLFHQAQQAHKEVMSNVAQFWSTLQSDPVDMVRLASLAKTITEKHYEGVRCYTKVPIHFGNHSVLDGYAEYLEHVIKDSEGAERCRLAIKDDTENSHGDVGATIGDALSQVGQPRSDKRLGASSWTVARLNLYVHVIMFFLVLVVIACIILVVVAASDALGHVSTMDTAGSLRHESQELAAAVLSYVEMAASGANASALRAANSSASALVDVFKLHLNDLTITNRNRNFVARVFSTFNHELRQEDSHEIHSLWTAANLVATSCREILSMENASTAVESSIWQTLWSNLDDEIPAVFNRSLREYVHNQKEVTSVCRGVYIGLYIAFVALCGIMYFSVAISFRRISATKLFALHLFGLIPRTAVDKLHKEALAHLETTHHVDAAKTEEANPVQQVPPANVLPVPEVISDQSTVARSSVASSNLTQDTNSSSVFIAPGASNRQFLAVARNSGFADSGKRLSAAIVLVDQYEDPYKKEDFFPTSEESASVLLRTRSPDNAEAEATMSQLTTRNGESAIQGSRMAGKSEHQQQSSTSVTQRAVLGAVFTYAFLVALCAVCVTYTTKGIDMNAGLCSFTSQSLSKFRDLYDLSYARMLLDSTVKKCVDAPSPDTFAVYWDTLKQRSDGAAWTSFVTSEEDTAALSQLYDTDDAWTVAERNHRIALRLVVAANNLSFRALDDFEWDNVSSFYFRPADQRTSAWHATSRIDLRRDASEQQAMATLLVNSDEQTALMAKATQPLGAVFAKQRASILREESDWDDRIRRYIILVAACSLTGAVFLLLLCAYLRLSGLLPHLVTLSAVLAFACLITVFGLSIAAIGHTRTENAIFDLLEFANDTLSLAMSTTDLTQKAVVSADPKAIYDFSSIVESGAVGTSFEQVLDRSGSHFFADLAGALSALQRSLRVQTVAVVLAVHRYGLDEPAALASQSWNFSAEADSAMIRLQYPTQEFYTTREADLDPRTDQEVLMKKLLFGPIVSDSFQEAKREFDSVIEAAEAQMLSSTNAYYDSEHAHYLGAQIFSIAALCLTIPVLVGVVNLLLLEPTKSQDMGRKTKAVFRSASWQLEGALAIIVLEATVVCIVIIVALTNAFSVIDVEESATTRQYAASRSLIAMQTLTSKTQDVGLFSETTMSLSRWTYLFYYGGGQFGVRDWDGKTQDLLFGRLNDDQQYSCSARDYTQLPTETTSFSQLLERGVDMLTRRWVSNARDVIANGTNDQSSLTKATARAASDYQQFSARLHETTLSFFNFEKHIIRTNELVFFLLVTLLCVTLCVSYLVVARPILSALALEEDGTKVVLQMIPMEVRETVPAIAEYMSTGVILHDIKLEEINDAISELSTIPIITINFSGVVEQFSRGAEELFGWSKEEVVGNNVSMLMPHNVATEHDAYLEHYRQTGEKRVLARPTRVRALCKSGVVIPIEIQVRESRAATKTRFIANIRNVNTDIEMERAMALSNALSEAATIPIVVINEKGVIQRFNSAAEQVFHYSARDVIGKKVNLLMPIAFAAQHDLFMQDYLRTGVKHIVDIQRQVQCKRSAGEIFPATLMVRELKRAEGRIFVGYIEDVTRQTSLRMATMINDAISRTSPVPLVSITDQGIVLSWNAAAVRTFGLQPFEIVGKNVKMIMPEAVAAKHDGYLAAYARLGKKKMIDNVTNVKAKKRDETGSFSLLNVSIAVKEIKKEGTPTVFFAYLRDISVVNQLAAECRILDALMSLSSVPLIIANHEGVIEEFSVAAVKIFEYSRDEALGKNVQMLMPDEAAQKHDEYLKQYLDTKVKHVIGKSTKVTGVKRSQKAFPLELTIHEAIYENQSSFIAFAKDLTERDHLQGINVPGSDVLELSAMMLVCIDDTGKILMCSEALCEKFLWSRSELLGQNIRVLMPDATGARHNSYLAAYAERESRLGATAARRESTVLHKEKHVIAKNREECTFSIAIQVHDIHVPGAPTMFVAHLQDISVDVHVATRKTLAEAVVSLSLSPLICIDRYGIVLVFSPSAETAFGYSREEVIGKNIKMLMMPEDANQHDGYLRAYAKTGIKTIIDSKHELKALKKSGETFSVEIAVKEVFLRDSSGNEVNQFIGYVRDLTAQQSLVSSTQLFDHMCESAFVPLVGSDMHGQILLFNHAAEVAFGYERHQVLGCNVRMLMAENVASSHDAYIEAYKRLGPIHHDSHPILSTARHQSGSTFPCEISIQEVRKRGESTQFIAMIRSMADYSAIEARCKVVEALTLHSPIPVIAASPSGIITHINSAAEQCFLYKAAELIGKNVSMLMPSAVASKHDGYVERYHLTGAKVAMNGSRMLAAKKKNGATFPVRVNLHESRETLSGPAHEHSSVVEALPSFIAAITDCSAEVEAGGLENATTLLINHTTAAVIQYDGEGVVEKISPSAEDLLHVKSKDVVGKELTAAFGVSSVAPFLIARQERDISGRPTISVSEGGQVEVFVIARPGVDEAKSQQASCFAFLRKVDTTQQRVALARAVSEDFPLPLCKVSAVGVMQWMNTAATVSFGRKASEVVGKDLSLILQYPHKTASEFLNSLKGSEPVVLSGLRGSSNTFPATVSRCSSSGDGFVLCVRDVSPTMVKEQDAASAKIILERSSEVLLVANSKGVVSAHSPPATRFFGNDGLVGCSIYDVIRICENGEKPSMSVLAEKRAHAVHVLRRDGSAFESQMAVVEAPPTKGKAHSDGRYVIRIQRAETVSEVDSAVVALMQVLPSAMFVVDRFGNVEDANGAALTLFHISSRSDIVGKNINILMPEEIARGHNLKLDAFFRNSTATPKGESTVRSRGKYFNSQNSTFPVEINIRSFRDTKNTFGTNSTKFVATIRSIERELAVESLRQNVVAAMDVFAEVSFVVGEQGEIWFVSSGAERVFECHAKDVVGAPLALLIRGVLQSTGSVNLTTFGTPAPTEGNTFKLDRTFAITLHITALNIPRKEDSSTLYRCTITV